MGGYTTTSLLAAIRRRVTASTATADGSSDADFIEYADAETLIGIVPLLMEVQEDYMVTYATQTLTSGTTRYRINYRAIGGKVRGVVRVSSAGDITEITRAPLEEAQNSVGDYRIEGNEIVLTADPGSTTDSLRVYFQTRPNSLVALTTGSTGAIAIVSSINTGTKTITTTATIPSTYSNSVTYDFVRAKPGYECLAIDQAASVASGTTLTFTTALPADLAVGDYVCLSTQTPVPQMPAEIHPVLIQRVVARYLDSRGDSEGFQRAMARLAIDEKKAFALITPRVDASPSRITAHNPLFTSATVPWMWRSS